MPITKGNESRNFDVLETGTFIDEISGLNGLPLGRMVEFWGEKDTGKSSCAMQAVAAAQKKGLKCLWIDAEYQYTSEYAEKLGVDTSKLDILREITAEDILDQAEKLIKENKYQVVVLDSIGQLSSRIVFEKEAGEKHIGTQASLIKEFVMKTIPYIFMNKILFIGISHERKTMEWNQLFSLGGFKWHEKLKLSIRFRDKRTLLKQGETVLGKVIVAEVTKNHLAGTFGKKMEVRLFNDKGFDIQADKLQALINAGKFRKEGNSYFLGETKIGTISKLREWAAANPDVLASL